MDEYIDKNLVLGAISETSNRLGGLVSMIENMPMADVEPIRHGRWIFDGDQWSYQCTECRGWVGNDTRYNYCPHCGCKMDLE